MNAYVGKDGLEKSFESYLHGTDGIRLTTVTSNGEVVDEHYAVEPKAGNNVELTIDIDLQAVAEKALESCILDLRENGGQVELIFRNTSRYPLNISSEELMERFVRGDESRNTEGSGLGISIAKSLMELMGGSFMLYVDGDLFKVVLGFAQMEEEKEPLDEDKSGK